MRRFAVLVIALVFAPGLKAAGISTFPNFVLAETRPEAVPVTRPENVPVVTRPLPLPVPEIIPEFLPEVEAVVPELITVNPCDACFQYMTALIEQLTEVAVPEETPVHPELPEVPVVARPLPESVEVGDLRPLPLPIVPEVQPHPIPVPSEAEQEEELVIQGRPLPTYIIRK